MKLYSDSGGPRGEDAVIRLFKPYTLYVGGKTRYQKLQGIFNQIYSDSVLP
jgi:hypothetical protein